jgi:hypothetical protein
MNAIIPLPRIPITIRPGTIEDLAFIDALQKKHTKQVGFMQTKALEGKIRAGHVLIAEERHEGTEARRHEGEEVGSASCIPSVPPCLRASVPVGYLIGNDQYFKRDDVGIVYQINVAEGRRRALVGAMLLKAQFERSAYGCRLYCCWCAQDIEANRFWESMGFVPLAFRAGSEKKSRVHIFWQKRIRAGDNETPWWFPAKTDGGAIREDRLVLPIPPGKHWSDEMPRILPREELPVASGQLPVAKKSRRAKDSPPTSGPVKHGARQYGAPPAVQAVAQSVKEKPKPQKKPKKKANPMHVAAARELRDRWLERVNEDPTMLESQGKYAVCKSLTATRVEGIGAIPAQISTSPKAIAA